MDTVWYNREWPIWRFRIQFVSEMSEQNREVWTEFPSCFINPSIVLTASCNWNQTLQMIIKWSVKTLVWPCSGLFIFRKNMLPKICKTLFYLTQCERLLILWPDKVHCNAKKLWNTCSESRKSPTTPPQPESEKFYYSLKCLI